MISELISKKTIDLYQSKSQDYLILIDKPQNWTSFNVVKKIKNVGNFKKVGHAGTLDPLATGLLIIGTGKKTRELTKISNDVKAYVATIRFGSQTDTYDVTGNIIMKKNITRIDLQRVDDILQSFLGESEQIAPMYSAKKQHGIRLYKLARQGREIHREPHKINIFEIKPIELQENDLSIYIKCSKGTYIRSLAHDIGIKCGYGANIANLRRISINDFYVEDALTIDEFQNYWMSLN